MKIGIIGLGFVGSSMEKSFKELGVNLTAVYDKFKNGGIGKIEDLLECDIIFSALPTVYCETLKEYDKGPLEETCNYLREKGYGGILVVKSTVEPGSCDGLWEKYGVRVVHNPEFLTARTAYEDFHNQRHVVLGATRGVSREELESVGEFYKKYYRNVEVSYCEAKESESMKIFCNSFYAVKVQFFNELYMVCQHGGMDYGKVIEMMLKNGWINSMHTRVPGPDGRMSYGGLCFPKDTNALNEYMRRNGLPNKVLEATIMERNEMREDRDNIK